MVILMLIVEEIIQQELKRNENMINIYSDIIDNSPKGTIEIKKISNEEYLYLKYREDTRVISKYCGKLCDNIQLVEQIEMKKHAKVLLKKLKEENIKLRKMVELL